jgi:LemA protein
MEWLVLAIVVVIALWGVLTFNGLVRRRTLVAEGWSGIEAQLKRRADLIPNLVETVKGYATHERATLDELTRLRGAVHSVGGKPPASGDVESRAQTENQITAMIGRVMAVAEAYPDLKASANFQSLQRDLADVEDEIQLSRRYYNGTVRDYNVMTEQVPSNLIASWFAFRKADFFEIENAADRAVPRVSFA